jgi:hypothetical protein
MHTLHMLFGAPEDVAAEHTLTRAPYKLMLSWIQCAEAMLRRLLLIEASAFPKPNTRLAAPKRSEGGPLLHEQRQPVRKLGAFDADKPEDWRVSLRCFHLPPRGGSAKPRSGEAKGRVASSDHFAISSPARGEDKKRFFSAWPLAERYEALIRVINNPEPYARRLARQLHALPHRIRELFRAPEEAQHRIEDWNVFDVSAQRAWPVADTS